MRINMEQKTSIDNVISKNKQKKWLYEIEPKPFIFLVEYKFLVNHANSILLKHNYHPEWIRSA